MSNEQKQSHSSFPNLLTLQHIPKPKRKCIFGMVVCLLSRTYRNTFPERVKHTKPSTNENGTIQPKCWELSYANRFGQYLELDSESIESLLPILISPPFEKETDKSPTLYHSPLPFLESLNWPKSDNLSIVFFIFNFSLSICNGYDSRVRFIIRELCNLMQVDWSYFCKQEQKFGTLIGQSLEGDKNTAKKSKYKWLKIGAAGVVGAAVMVLTAGLAAPAVIGGVAAVTGAIGGATGAVGTVAVSLLGGAAGTALVTSIFGVVGGGLVGFKMKKRVDGIDEFQFHLLKPNQIPPLPPPSPSRTSDASSFSLSSASSITNIGNKNSKGHEQVKEKKKKKEKTENMDEKKEDGQEKKEDRRMHVIIAVNGWIKRSSQKSSCKLVKKSHGLPSSINLQSKENKQDVVSSNASSLVQSEPKQVQSQLSPTLLQVTQEQQQYVSPSLQQIQSESDVNDAKEIQNYIQMESPLQAREGKQVREAELDTYSSLHSVPDSETIESVSIPTSLSRSETIQPYSNSFYLPPYIYELWSFLPTTSPFSEVYLLKWATKELYEFIVSIEKFVTDQVVDYVGGKVVEQLISAMVLPMQVMSWFRYIDEPYTIILKRADQAAIVLADALESRVQGNRPVTLVGYSMGARVIFQALLELVRRKNERQKKANASGNSNLPSSPISSISSSIVPPLSSSSSTGSTSVSSNTSTLTDNTKMDLTKHLITTHVNDVKETISETKMNTHPVVNQQIKNSNEITNNNDIDSTTTATTSVNNTIDKNNTDTSTNHASNNTNDNTCNSTSNSEEPEGKGSCIVVDELGEEAVENEDVVDGIIFDVILLGAPLIVEKKKWAQVRKIIAGRFVHGYSKNDWILRWFHRTKEIGLKVAGLGPIDVPGVENIELTNVVNGHSDYANKVDSIFDLIHFKC